MYGFYDGQNSLCPQMNYSGKCPEPYEYKNLLLNDLPSQPYTQSLDQFLFIMQSLGLAILTPATSCLIKGGKEVITYAKNRYNTFKPSFSERIPVALERDASPSALRSIV